MLHIYAFRGDALNSPAIYEAALALGGRLDLHPLSDASGRSVLLAICYQRTRRRTGLSAPEFTAHQTNGQSNSQSDISDHVELVR